MSLLNGCGSDRIEWSEPQGAWHQKSKLLQYTLLYRDGTLQSVYTAGAEQQKGRLDLAVKPS